MQRSTAVGSISKRGSKPPTRRDVVTVHEPEPEPELEPEHEEWRVEPAPGSTHAPLQQRRRQPLQLHISAAPTHIQPWALPSPRSLFRHRYLASIGAVDSRQIILEPSGARDRRMQHSMPLQQRSMSSAGSFGVDSTHHSASLPRRHRTSSRVQDPRRDVAIDNGGPRPRLVMSGFGRVSL
jgi:hypothetical protein